MQCGSLSNRVILNNIADHVLFVFFTLLVIIGANPRRTREEAEGPLTGGLLETLLGELTFTNDTLPFVKGHGVQVIKTLDVVYLSFKVS